MFYLLTQERTDENGEVIQDIVGYFSKEKLSPENFNLSCILVFPPYMRKGYGRTLIEFSYELSKLENKIGSPERPLSDLGRIFFVILGLIGYQNYWQTVLIDILHSNPTMQLTIRELSLLTSIRFIIVFISRQEDIASTLSSMGFLRFWKSDQFVWYKIICLPHIQCFSRYD